MILIIVGPNLGHVTRALLIGNELLKEGWKVEYACADICKFAQTLIEPLFKLHKLSENVIGDNAYSFTEDILKLLKKTKPSIVCYDLSPIPWLIQLPDLNIPEVYITNVFLTGLGSEETNQQLSFEKRKNLWNKIRHSRNLPELVNYRELYDKKLVLLADPQFITDLYILPENYHCIGSCTWQPEMEGNNKYQEMGNILFVSTGSTGKKKIPDLLVNSIKQYLNCNAIVKTETNNNNDSANRFLPSNTILKHSTFAITQGGTGSTYQALENGVPVGCWPTSKNHRILGQLLEQLELGILFEEHNWREKLKFLETGFSELSTKAKTASEEIKRMNLIIKTSRLINNLL